MDIYHLKRVTAKLTYDPVSFKSDLLSIKSDPVSFKSDPLSIKSDPTIIMSHIARNQLIYQPESETYNPDKTD